MDRKLRTFASEIIQILKEFSIKPHAFLYAAYPLSVRARISSVLAKEMIEMIASRTGKLLIVTLIVILTLIPIGSASAVKPVKYVWEEPFLGEWFANCGDYDLLGDSVYKWSISEYYDRDGNLVEIRGHLVITNSKVYNSEHPEISLPEGPDHIYFWVDPDTGIMTQSGLALKVNVPGYGIVAIDVGRIIFDVFPNYIWERGKHMYFKGELDALCSALADD